MVTMLLVNFGDVAVALVPWPSDTAGLDACAAEGCPRLLLVDAVAEPPVVDDELEDWVRLPAADRDLEVRARRLARIASARRSPSHGVGRTRRLAMITARAGSPRA
jgi:hypothetical protein